MAVSAGGVSLAGLGVLFIWSGLANVHPLETLHSLVSGSPIQLGGAGSNASGPTPLPPALTGPIPTGANSPLQQAVNGLIKPAPPGTPGASS